MSPLKPVEGIPQQYDHALRYGRYTRLPDDHPRPKPTSEWPPENVALLEEYIEWLLGGGTAAEVTRRLYLPMAGHVLGLFLRPHTELDPDRDLQPAMDFVRAKQLSRDWTEVCAVGLERFRRFLYQKRGIPEVTVTPFKPAIHTGGLPDWLVTELTNYQLIRQRNWRPARLEESIRRFWSGHLRVWRFLCEECGVEVLEDIRRQQLFDYIRHRLDNGKAITGINNNLRELQVFFKFLQEQGYHVPLSLRRMPTLKQPKRLPRFLTDEQVGKLREDFEERVRMAPDTHTRRSALLDRAAFYLLWQGGMRLGEVEELRLEDLDLEDRQLTVRLGKGLKDRTVYLTEALVQALAAYLAERGTGSSDHVFLYRNRALRKDLVRGRIKAAGKRVGVRVHPHRLRHTCATQLLNAGCKVTSIQRFLGHKDLNSTMVYARVHDHTVARDYFAAMEQVEGKLNEEE